MSSSVSSRISGRQAVAGRGEPERARVGDQRELPPVGRALGVEHRQLARTGPARSTAPAAARRTSCPPAAARRPARVPHQRDRDELAALVQADRRRTPDVGRLAGQQRRPADRHGQRVTVGHPQRVPPVGGRVAADEHLRLGDVEAGGDLVLGVDRVLEAPAVGQVDQHAGAVAVAGHAGAELDLLAGLVGVGQPGRVVGPEHDVGVQHPEPGGHLGRGHDRLVRRAPSRASSGSATRPPGPTPTTARRASRNAATATPATSAARMPPRPSGSPDSCAAS